MAEHLTTQEAAEALGRAPQTLRKWACLENGPIRPIRVNGRLAWRRADVESLLQQTLTEPLTPLPPPQLQALYTLLGQVQNSIARLETLASRIERLEQTVQHLCNGDGPAARKRWREGASRP